MNDEDIALVLAQLQSSTDSVWLLRSAVQVLSMQAGFAMLESGVSSKGSVVNIMMKNVADVGLAAVIYWAIGWGLSYGPDGNSFIGLGEFFFSDNDQAAMFMFQFSFAATCATIVSGILVERANYSAYLLISVVISGLIYPPAAHWIWSSNGFLAEMGAFDFAGAGPVHLVGATSALVAGLIVGPRRAAVKAGSRVLKSPPPSSPQAAILGLFLLWWGWYGFNMGSTGGVSGGYSALIGPIAITTSLGAGAGTTTGLLLMSLFDDCYEVGTIVNATLGGLVAITPACATVSNGEAVLIGVIAALVTRFIENLLLRSGLDDPVGVIPVHGGTAIWGIIATGLFSREVELLGNSAGLLHGGPWSFMMAQLALIGAMLVWTLVTSFLSFWLINKLIGLRVSAEVEDNGLDALEHGIKPSSSVTKLTDMMKLFKPRRSSSVGSPRIKRFSNAGSGSSLESGLGPKKAFEVEPQPESMMRPATETGGGVGNNPGATKKQPAAVVRGKRAAVRPAGPRLPGSIPDRGSKGYVVK